jgi:SAM-dependent methyltransferase
MQYLTSGYANWCGRRHRRPGHTFQGRFKSELIEDESYFWTVSRYIHLNPVRGKRPLAVHPRDWPWSSYSGYDRRRRRVEWVAYDALYSAWRFQVDVREEDVFDSSLPSEGADVVLCGFGLKTLSIGRRALLAREIYRVLKAGGQFSLVEISVPSFFLLRKLFLFYLRWIIPWIGKLFLGNPDNYRMLSVYTEAFKDCKESLEAFKDAGFDAQVRSYFFGCATAITGFKPK